MSNKPKGVSIHPQNMLYFKHNIRWRMYLDFVKYYGHIGGISTNYYEYILASNTDRIYTNFLENLRKQLERKKQ